MASFPAEEGGTHQVNAGTGDWYARQGMAHKFIRADDQQDLARRIAMELKDGTGD